MIYILFALIMVIIFGVCIVVHRRINGMYDLMARLLIDVFELETKIKETQPPIEGPAVNEEEQRKAAEAAKQFTDGVANILAYDFEKIMKRNGGVEDE